MPNVVSPEQALHNTGSAKLTSRGSLELRKDRRNKAKVYFNSGTIYYADLQGYEPALLQRLKWSLELALPEDDPKRVDIQAILTGYKGKNILNQLLSRRLITDKMLGNISRERFIATMQLILQWDKVTTRWNVRDGIDRKDPYNIPDPLNAEHLFAYLEKHRSYHVAFAQWLNVSENDLQNLQVIPPAEFSTVIPETDEEFLIISCLGEKPTFTKLVEESGFMMPSKILQALAVLHKEGVLDFYLNGKKIIVPTNTTAEEHFNYLVESRVKHSDQFAARSSRAKGTDNFISNIKAFKEDDEPTELPVLPPEMLEEEPTPVEPITEEDMYIEVNITHTDLVEPEIETEVVTTVEYSEGFELPTLSAFAVRPVIPEESLPNIEEETILKDDPSEEHEFIIDYEDEHASTSIREEINEEITLSEECAPIEFNVSAGGEQDDQYTIFDIPEGAPLETNSEFTESSLGVKEPVSSININECPETHELISHHTILDSTDKEQFGLQEELLNINTPLCGNGTEDDDVFNQLTGILRRAKESISRDRECFNEINAKYQEAESAYQKQITRLKEIEEEYNRLSTIVQESSQSIKKLRSNRDALASRITERENQLKAYLS